MIIENGADGPKIAQKIDNTNRGLTRSVTNNALEEAVINGDSYTITTGEVTLTSANESAILFYKNQEDSTVILTRTLFIAGASTGGSGTYSFTTRIGPSAMASGTGNDLDQINLNFGSSKELTVTDSEKGQEAATVTGGSNSIPVKFATDSTNAVTTFVALPKGATIGHLVTPPTGNTSMTIQTAMNIYIVKNL